LEYLWRLIKPATGPLNRKRSTLFQVMADKFDHDELAELAFALGVRPDHVFGENDTARQKALALELWTVQREKRGELLDRLGELRPNVDWAGYG